MNAREKALADQNPTFADLCDRVRAARRKHLRAIAHVEHAKQVLKLANEALDQSLDEGGFARDALDAFIERETQVDD